MRPTSACGSGSVSVAAPATAAGSVAVTVAGSASESVSVAESVTVSDSVGAKPAPGASPSRDILRREVPTDHSDTNRSGAGFSLLECIFAIAVIGAALIISSAMMNSLARASEQLQAHTAMLRELEAAVEMMRSGFLPLESGVLASNGAGAHFSDLEVTAVVKNQPQDGLYHITLRAECTLRRHRVSRTLTTQVWRR